MSHEYWRVVQGDLCFLNGYLQYFIFILNPQFLNSPKQFSTEFNSSIKRDNKITWKCLLALYGNLLVICKKTNSGKQQNRKIVDGKTLAPFCCRICKLFIWTLIKKVLAFSIINDVFLNFVNRTIL